DNIKQDMCFLKDYKDYDLCSKPKGLMEVLSERGLWHDRIKLVYKSVCKQRRANCYARTTMANQPNFRAQCRRLEELIISASHEVIFYSKFYCELNYIENF
ncbi:11531_t:CDS:1, partial [Cetraspora pellucida]